MAFSTATEASEPGHSPTKSPTRQATQSRPFVCSICNRCFRRLDHLKRHAKLHACGKHYQCPCGETFSRNDVLAQHLRRCNQSRTQPVTNTAPQTRSKRACDRCAKSKIKCDYQQPCDRCAAKQLVCEFTRPGYEDPYKQYGIKNGSETTTGDEDIAFTGSNPDESPSHSHTVFPKQTGGIVQNPGAPPSQSVIGNVPFFSHQRAQDPNPIDDLTGSDCTNLNYLPMDFDFWPMWDWEISEDFQQQLDPVEEILEVPVATYDIPPNSLLQNEPPRLARFGYSINQIDPVEAKCAAIRSLLHTSDPLVTKDIISADITRDKLLLCINLYGKLFQRNYPILHSPTFTLVDTPPILLFAMMLTGACYSDVISNENITKFCMSLLISIEKLPHETYMQVPSLSTIQASIIICGILICSRNEVASKFVSVHFARNISMANRARVFDEVPSLDYTTMTEETFDWARWVEQESKNRMACEILSQDMAACVFNGKSPSLSPLTLKVELPCYESCWEAQTSSECFKLLQKLPRQMQVATASRALRTSSLSVEKTALFEASSFGMSTLIMGLHGFLFQTIQEDIDPGLDTGSMPFSFHNVNTSSSDDRTQLNHLKQDLSGTSIARYADFSVSKSGSFAINRANAVLNAWHSTWENRHVRDYGYEEITFKGDPLRFWWLAKLLLVAHVQSRAISQDSELAIPSPSAGDEKGKIALQTKLVKWLARFRMQGKEADLPDEVNVLSDLMKAR